MLMKYKDFKTLSQDEMKVVTGGRACIPAGSGCSVSAQNCGCGLCCVWDGVVIYPQPHNYICAVCIAEA